MKRFITLVMLLALSVVSALLIRDLLTSSDLDGVTVLPLGRASLNFQYTINTGVNFGLIQEASTTRQLILSSVALLICITVIIWGYRSRQKWAAGAAGLFAGGGLANAYERIAFGGVFDYLSFSTSFFNNPFSFNLADIYIFIGLILFLLAPREARESADGPTRPSSLGPIFNFAGNSGLTLSLLGVVPLHFLADTIAGQLPLRPDLRLE
jgi:signal peptidase II